MAQNPRLLMQIDREAVAEAYDLCVRHLGGVSRDRRGALVSLAASVAFSVLTVAVLVVVVLYWRGLM